MIHAQIYSDTTRTNFGYEIREGANKLHESEAIFTKEIAQEISDVVIKTLTELSDKQG